MAHDEAEIPSTGGLELKTNSTEAAADGAAYRAIDAIYHAYLTGLILMLSSRAGPQRAAGIVFKTFRRQQLALFLPGLKKLGLDHLPHAVACAQYHYLSNQVGGVKVEYIPENDRKAWVRYPPPRGSGGERRSAAFLPKCRGRS